MDNKDNFWHDSSEENENQTEENIEQGNDSKALMEPETYYHNINTPSEQKEDRYYEVFDKNKPKKMSWSLASVILGILSVICCSFGFVGLVMGFAAVACAIVSRCSLKYFDNMSIIGLIVGIFGIVFSSASVLISFLFANQ